MIEFATRSWSTRTATDLSNNTCTKSTSFYIRNAIDNNEIETFSDYGANETNFAFDGSNFSGTKLKTHVSSFTRSSKSDYSICFNNNNLNNLVFVTEPRLDKDTLIELLNEEGNYISFYIYIDDENNASQEINYKNSDYNHCLNGCRWRAVLSNVSRA